MRNHFSENENQLASQLAAIFDALEKIEGRLATLEQSGGSDEIDVEQIADLTDEEIQEAVEAGEITAEEGENLSAIRDSLAGSQESNELSDPQEDQQQMGQQQKAGQLLPPRREMRSKREFSAQQARIVELETMNEALRHALRAGVRPLSHSTSGETHTSGRLHEFDALVGGKQSRGLSKAEAIQQAARENPEAYLEHLARRGLVKP